MANTTRKFCTNGNYREARKGRPYVSRKSGTSREALIAAGFVKDGEPTLSLQIREAAAPWQSFRRKGRRGGMLMSPSNSGLWNDERAAPVEKRAIKRGERQNWKRNIQREGDPS